MKIEKVLEVLKEGGFEERVKRGEIWVRKHSRAVVCCDCDPAAELLKERLGGKVWKNPMYFEAVWYPEGGEWIE